MIISPSKLDKTSNDLPFNILRAYKTVSVHDFKAAIDRICDSSENSNKPDKWMEVYIVDYADNKKYSLIKQCSWNIQDRWYKKIIVLEAKIRTLERVNCAHKSKQIAQGQDKKVFMTKKPSNIHKAVVFKRKRFWWSPSRLRRHKPSKYNGIWTVIKLKGL